ncbi:flagellar assembly protein FliW [Clostridium sp. 19966]|uniref:flagellar assembly protein FliW n=1 Tax=Clostridium sp. 19966 TaxID=2768166 RepID=UPI0028DEC178|nr:flagellar assembly protein FliW [Clostridium sp. 19966]MDT8716671.1 flagellar assembly protein FliW [Clostridium sp. 19966]
MEIETRFHGKINFDENKIITFNKGLPGLEQLHKFILFPVEGNGSFSILHSVEDMDIALVVTSPFNIIKDYEFEIDDTIVEELKIIDAKNVLVLSTVSIYRQKEKITTNLKAPIIINMESNLGEQLILDNEKYIIKYPIFQE